MRPACFLRLHAGGPRGLWARGDRWVAHAGVLAEIRTRDGDGGRFVDTRDVAASIVGSSDDLPGDTGGVRFYGGFSFRDDHRPLHVWQGFPAGLFQLPEVELDGDAGDAVRLAVRAAVPRGADPGEVLAAAEAKALGIARDLGVGERGGRVPPVVDARRVETDRGAWERAVEEALGEIAAGRFTKAVLARTLDVTPEVEVDPVDVVLALWAQSRGAHAFLYEPEPGRSVVGAAPETVATVHGDAFNATAVAGSIRTGDGPGEREVLARRLLASRKDRAEQRVVVEDMVRRLEPLADEIRAQAEPHVLTLARIQHLETEIRARVPEGVHVLDLLAALHPTPAVCGVPRDAALAFLEREEPFERGWYAGPVGWFDTDGQGVFVPALRTAVVSGGAWRLFAGAGIVAGSDPRSEWEETGIKLEPVLRALEEAGVTIAPADLPQ